MSAPLQAVRGMNDILPGEAVYIENNGRLHSHPCGGPRSYTPCIFEFVYFARPDSDVELCIVADGAAPSSRCTASRARHPAATGTAASPTTTCTCTTSRR